MIFVDTGAWYALTVPTDPDHKSASAYFAAIREPLVTTDYVVDETLTLLRSRGHQRRALAIGGRFFRGELAQIHYLTRAEVVAAWQVFQRFADKEWSFTDCTSRS